MSNWWKRLAASTASRGVAHADDPAPIAVQHAANETARFVGVVLARESFSGQPIAPGGAMTARESLTWHAFPMTSAAQLAAWYDDWVGTPALYLYLAAFDKESEAWARGNADLAAAPDAHGGRSVVVGASSSGQPIAPHGAMTGALTLPELTHTMLDQDYRWAGIVDKARRARHPIAPVALRFFKITWEPTLRRYMTRIGALNPARATDVIDAVLARMHALYAMARAIGFPESSFLLPDITLDYDTHPEIS
jgi:hypothetical protein